MYIKTPRPRQDFQLLKCLNYIKKKIIQPNMMKCHLYFPKAPVDRKINFLPDV